MSAQASSPAILETRVGEYTWLRDTFEPNPKQRLFNAVCEMPYPVTEILIDGAIRSGKTQVAMKKMVGWAMRYPRTTWIIFRKTRQELEDSTKKILLDGVEMPPVLPPQLLAQRWDSDKNNKAKLVNGSEILFRSLEPNERGKIRNFTVAGMLIDQAEELDDDEVDEPYYIELVGRISDPRTPMKMLLIANPAPETHWIARRFGCTDETEAVRSDELKARCKRVHVTLLDNADNLHPNLVKRYMETAITSPDYYARMIEGKWGAFGGKRFKRWDPARHLFDAEELPEIIPADWECVEGGDWGTENPCAWLWSLIDFTGRWWVIAEHYRNGETVKWHADQIKRIRENRDEQGAPLLPWVGELQPSASYLDPSAWNRQRKEISTVADAFVEHGIYVTRAQNDRLGGWNRIEEYLNETMDDGYPRLRIYRGLTNLRRELPNLKIKVGTDDVEKMHDHTPDALRYKVMSRFPAPVDRTVMPADRSREALVKRAIEKRKKALTRHSRPVRM